MQILDLRALRAWPKSWTMLSYSDGHNDDGDEALTRFAFKAEVMAHEALPQHGLSDALVLGAFLLARIRKPRDIALLARAKAANFDTQMGFAVNFLFVALGGDTARSCGVDAAQFARWEDAWGNLRQVPDGFDVWWADLDRKFPGLETLESPMALADRYLEWDEPNRAVDILKQRIANDSDRKLRDKLVYALIATERYDEAAIEISIQLPACSDEHDLAFKLVALIEVHTRARNFSRAARATARLDGLFSDTAALLDSGLPRRASTGALQLVIEHPGDAAAQRVYETATAWLEDQSNLSLSDLETAFYAARRCGREQDEHAYAERAAHQRKEMDELFSQ